MARTRPPRQDAIEHALALLSVIRVEARILRAHGEHARNIADSRPIIVDCAGRIEKAGDKARAALSMAWDGMEVEFHDQT